MKIVRICGLFLAVFAAAMLGYTLWLHSWALDMERQLRSMNKFARPLTHPGVGVYVVWSLVFVMSIGVFRWAGKKRDGDKAKHLELAALHVADDAFSPLTEDEWPQEHR